jgi:hypothetical protein
MATYNSVEYVAVSQSANSFRQPRQKMWGIFIAEEKSGDTAKWSLIYSSNDFIAAKELFNSYLQDPEVDPAKAGMDNIIFTEIVPADSRARI